MSKQHLLPRAGAVFSLAATLAAFACTTEPGSEPAAKQSRAALTGPALSIIKPVQHPGQNGPIPSCNGSQLEYYGGRVLAGVEVVQVLWGTGVDNDVATKMAAYYTAILQSPYMDWLGEYDTFNKTGVGPTSHPGSNQHIGRGKFLKTVQITPANTAQTVSDDDINTEINAQIDAGKLPTPTDDGQGGYRTIYMIDFPAGITINGPGGSTSCVEFCAYHSAGTYKNKTITWGVHPDLGQQGCNGGCGQGTLFDNNTSVHSHELIEATTDPDLALLIKNGGNALDYPAAWAQGKSGCTEIGDICNAEMGTVGTFTVQTEWSNSKNNCITQVSGLPTCTGGAGACTPCTSDSQCSGNKPICDMSMTPANGTCRACVDSDCKAPTPVCVKSGGGGGDGGGAGDGGGGGNAGKCVECVSNADCAMSPNGGTCDTTTNQCRPCTSDSECAMGHCATGATDPEKGKCVQCTTDAQCMTGTVCDTKKDTCVGCTSNTQCKNPKPVCDVSGTESCGGCKTDADCAGNADGTSCNTTSGICQQPSDGGGGGGSSSGCAMAPSGRGAFGFAGAIGVLLGLAAMRRRRA